MKTRGWRSGVPRTLAGAGLLVCLAVAGSGCGAEKQTPVAAPTSGSIPGGGDQDEYRKKMMENATGRPGGGAAMPGPGMPGAPGRPPGGR